MSAKEWLSAPWWEQRLLTEGMAEEGLISMGEDAAPEDGPATDGLQGESVYTQGGVTVTERNYSYDLGDAETLPEGDFTVGTIG